MTKSDIYLALSGPPNCGSSRGHVDYDGRKLALGTSDGIC